MQILREGDRGMALAPNRGRVEIVYRYRPIELEDTGVTVKDVLVGVDPDTDEILTVPAQSTPKLKAARDTRKDVVMSIRVPRELDDVLALVADRYHTGAEQFAPAVIRYYLAAAASDAGLAERLERLGRSPLATGRCGTNLRLRVRRELHEAIDRLASSAEGVNMSVLVRGAIVAAKEDVLDGRARGRTRELGAIARAV